MKNIFFLSVFLAVFCHIQCGREDGHSISQEIAMQRAMSELKAELEDLRKENKSLSDLVRKLINDLTKLMGSYHDATMGYNEEAAKYVKLAAALADKVIARAVRC